MRMEWERGRFVNRPCDAVQNRVVILRKGSRRRISTAQTRYTEADKRNEPCAGGEILRCAQDVSAQQSTAYKNVRRYEILSQKLEKLQVSFSRKREETG